MRVGGGGKSVGTTIERSISTSPKVLATSSSLSLSLFVIHCERRSNLDI